MDDDPCYLTRLPVELLLKILAYDIYGPSFRKKKLRLIDKFFAELLAPEILQCIFIDTERKWPLKQNRGPRYMAPECPDLSHPNHRIPICRLYIGDRHRFDEYSFLAWTRKSNNFDEFAKMFGQVVYLDVYTNAGANTHAALTLSHKSHNFFLQAMNNVERLKLGSNVVDDKLTGYVHGMVFPNLHHLELHGLSCTQSYFGEFLTGLVRPLEKLDLSDMHITPRSWYDIFVTLKTKHKLRWLRMAWGPQTETVEGANRQSRDAIGVQMEQVFGDTVTMPKWTQYTTSHHVLWEK